MQTMNDEYEDEVCPVLADSIEQTRTRSSLSPWQSARGLRHELN